MVACVVEKKIFLKQKTQTKKKIAELDEKEQLLRKTKSRG